MVFNYTNQKYIPEQYLSSVFKLPQILKINKEKISSERAKLMSNNHFRNAVGGRRSSLTDLDAEAQAKLI